MTSTTEEVVTVAGDEFEAMPQARNVLLLSYAPVAAISRDGFKKLLERLDEPLNPGKAFNLTTGDDEEETEIQRNELEE